MIAIIDLYCKELLKVNGFSPSTVETYELSSMAFCRFIKDELQTDLVDINGPLLLKWILHLKSTGIGHSRIEGHHVCGTLLTSVTNAKATCHLSLSLKYPMWILPPTTGLR
jgi:hypothetical protein